MTDIKTTSGHLPESIYLLSSWWPESPKNYLVSKAFIKRLIDAEKVIVRIDLKEEYHGKKFVEGKFSTDFPSTARPGFRKFYKKLESFK
jgi:hypothetical protein